MLMPHRCPKYRPILISHPHTALPLGLNRFATSHGATSLPWPCARSPLDLFYCSYEQETKVLRVRKDHLRGQLWCRTARVRITRLARDAHNHTRRLFCYCDRWADAKDNTSGTGAGLQQCPHAKRPPKACDRRCRRPGELA